ncbi:MAG: hypothetical protein U0521_28000 [Anaerolineae bacterium]
MQDSGSRASGAGRSGDCRIRRHSSRRYVRLALTTIAQFQEQIGRRAAEMLLERLSTTEMLAGRSIDAL